MSSCVPGFWLAQLGELLCWSPKEVLNMLLDILVLNSGESFGLEVEI